MYTDLPSSPSPDLVLNPIPIRSRTPTPTPNSTPIRRPVRSMSRSMSRSPNRSTSLSPIRSRTPTPAPTPNSTPIRRSFRSMSRSRSRSPNRSPNRSTRLSPIRIRNPTPAPNTNSTPIRRPVRSMSRSRSRSPNRSTSLSLIRAQNPTPTPNPIVDKCKIPNVTTVDPSAYFLLHIKVETARGRSYEDIRTKREMRFIDWTLLNDKQRDLLRTKTRGQGDFPEWRLPGMDLSGDCHWFYVDTSVRFMNMTKTMYLTLDKFKQLVEDNTTPLSEDELGIFNILKISNTEQQEWDWQPKWPCNLMGIGYVAIRECNYPGYKRLNRPSNYWDIRRKYTG